MVKRLCLSHYIGQCWRSSSKWLIVLWPLACMYRWFTKNICIAQRIIRNDSPHIWLICNILSGGTGKTPFVIALHHWLQQHMNMTCAIVVGGYGSQITGLHIVSTDDDVCHVGDEAMLLLQTTGALVVVCRQRNKAIDYIQHSHPEIRMILLDDGLQNRDTSFHRALHLEKPTKNKMVIPCGPYRNQFSDVEHLLDLSLGYAQSSCHSDALPYLKLTRIISGFRGADGQLYPNTYFAGQTVHAIAGIGEPNQFFHMLQSLGMTVISHPYPDHGHFPSHLLACLGDLPIITTAKDAVKLSAQKQSVWVAELDVLLPKALTTQLSQWL